MNNQDDNDVSEKTVIVTTSQSSEAENNRLEPFLIFLSGAQTAQQVSLLNRNVKIGRDVSCEVIVDDPHVSRVHAEIVWENNQAILKDLGSTNGVIVNGQRVKEHPLSNNEKFIIGTRLHFKFSYLDGTEQNYQERVFNQANIDTLTGVYTRKFFLDILSKEFSFSRRNGQPLSLLMIDIDHFKKINDTHGHMAGDAVLRRVGHLLKGGLRMENIAARYGGEEFSIILRHVHSELALQIAERLRKTIESEQFRFKETRIPVTISIGIATLEKDNFATYEDLIHTADQYLYEAKEKGRNRTVLKKAA